MAPAFLVTGATGAQGGGVAKELLARNLKVHAFVRDPTSAAALELQSLGATLFKGDFDDVPAITAATQGCTGVFLNTFPSFIDPNGEGNIAQRFVTAALEAKTVTHFIASTVTRPRDEELKGKETDYPFLCFYYKQKGGVEDVVRNAGFEYYTTFRPGFLSYNYLAPYTQWHFPDYPTKHIMDVSFPADYQIESFDPADVGKFTALAFVEPEQFNGKEMDLLNETFTIEEIAAIISKVSGVEIKINYRTDEETKAILESGTFPTIQSHIWRKYHPQTRNNRHLVKYGIKMTALEEYLEREKDRLLATLSLKDTKANQN